MKSTLNLFVLVLKFSHSLAMVLENSTEVSTSAEDTDSTSINLGQQTYFQADSEMIKIYNAMRKIEFNTCIRFKVHTREPNYIFITNTTNGCFVRGVGMAGGAQEVSLQSTRRATCMTPDTIMHELFHVLGLWHEHSRHDRDDYVTIHWNNIRPGLDAQFAIIAKTRSDTYQLPYDYKSVMHYDSRAFSKDKRQYNTMEPKDPAFTSIIGHVTEASEGDWEKLRRIYDCQTSRGGSSVCQDKLANCPRLLGSCLISSIVKQYCPITCKLC